jgi:hypothetical protein
MHYNLDGTTDWHTLNPEQVVDLIWEKSIFRRNQLYKDAVEFCFQQSPVYRNEKWQRGNWNLTTRNEREVAYNEDMRRDFYKRVYLPYVYLIRLLECSHSNTRVG